MGMSKRVPALRSEEMHNRYRDFIGNKEPDSSFFFTGSAVKEYMHWRLIDNDFPYDVLASRHCILTPRRKFQEDWEMVESERAELFEIKKELGNDFDTIMENFGHQRTFSMHYHLHFIKFNE